MVMAPESTAPLDVSALAWINVLPVPPSSCTAPPNMAISPAALIVLGSKKPTLVAMVLPFVINKFPVAEIGRLSPTFSLLS